ncbi:TPM domain-containing protein, partial [Pseudonocardia sp. KRD-188]
MDHRRVVPRPASRAALAVLGVLLALVLAAPAALAQEDDVFPGLEPGVRVYDETGSSLTPAQTADLQGRLDALRATGADAVVLVRALDASSDDTFDQVEALQQAWAARTGADQDTAVAILVNRNPDDPTDARAGVFVGRTFDDGNVPQDEQEAIVEDALIPPLRDGDVHGSLVAGIGRLSDSIRFGPPVSAAEQWAASASRSWLPTAAVVAALVALVGAVGLF